MRLTVPKAAMFQSGPGPRVTCVRPTAHCTPGAENFLYFVLRLRNQYKDVNRCQTRGEFPGHPSWKDILNFTSSKPALCVSCRLLLTMDRPSECHENTTALEETQQPLDTTRIQPFEPTPTYDSDASDSTIESQDIAGKRVNPAKLIALLRTKFGAGRFKIRVCWTRHDFSC